MGPMVVAMRIGLVPCYISDNTHIPNLYGRIRIGDRRHRANGVVRPYRRDDKGFPDRPAVFVNKIFKNDKEKDPSFVFKSLLAVSIISFIFNAGIFIYGNSLISFMNLQENDISAISTYLKLETVTFMIGKMVNVVSEQGNYWVANNFIWGWLLIPVTALVEIIKTDCKEEDKKMIRSNYYFISLFIFVVWGLTLPCWKPFLAYAERLENAGHIFGILLKLVPFYVAYTLCTIPDLIFIGKGKTYLNAINSVLTNFAYYGIWFTLYKTNSITFTIDISILMFGFGMVFRMIISFVEQWWYDKKSSMLSPCESEDQRIS